MKPVAILLILAGALLFSGCQSETERTATRSTKTAQPECVCGTHEAQLHGCHAPQCVSGQGNPDNPKCFCAPLVPAGAPAKGS